MPLNEMLSGVSVDALTMAPSSLLKKSSNVDLKYCGTSL